MKYNYQYLFTLTKADSTVEIVRSSESAESLPNRAGNEHDKNLILDFIEKATPGSFIQLDTGEVIFKSSE